jgi:transposase InsO family protein
MPGGFTHLLVAVDKFTKWIEARPVTTAKSTQAAAFFQDIVHSFGVTNSIITDNGTNFMGKEFLEFCDDHHIHVDCAAVAHPRTNGQVERANGMVLEWASRAGERHGPARTQAQNFQSAQKIRRTMGRGAPSRPVELENNSEPCHRVYAILYGI